MARKPRAAAVAAAGQISAAVAPANPSSDAKPDGATQAAGESASGPAGGEPATSSAGSGAETIVGTGVGTGAGESLPEIKPDAETAEQAGEGLPRLKVKGPRNGSRRRGGFQFGGEAVILTPGDFTQGIEGADRFVAIVSDPLLECSFLFADGTEQAVPADHIEYLRAAVELARSSGELRTENADIGDLIADLLGGEQD